MFGRIVKDVEKPKIVTGKLQSPAKRHLGPVSVITSESTTPTTPYLQEVDHPRVQGCGAGFWAAAGNGSQSPTAPSAPIISRAPLCSSVACFPVLLTFVDRSVSCFERVKMSNLLPNAAHAQEEGDASQESPSCQNVPCP